MRWAGARWTVLADPRYHSEYSECHYYRERSSACMRVRTRAPTRAHTGACMHTEARVTMRMLQAGTTAREMAMDKIGSHTVEIIVKSAPSEIFLLLCDPPRYVLACACVCVRACVRAGSCCRLSCLPVSATHCLWRTVSVVCWVLTGTPSRSADSWRTWRSTKQQTSSCNRS